MTDEYDAIARRFFNQFLELKIQLDQGSLTVPKNYDKELAQYKKANAELRKAAADLAESNAALEQELLSLEEEKRTLRGQVNEGLVTIGALNEKLQGLGVVRREVAKSGYSFVEHMSDESRRAWESLMREIPRPGSG